jgi:hypothetical protein
VRVKLPLSACVLASGCYAWPIAKAPTPGAGCVQVSVPGRQRHYWKNLGELEPLPAPWVWGCPMGCMRARTPERTPRSQSQALAIGGTWIAAEVSDHKLREAVI